jgi:hypothetical protein
VKKFPSAREIFETAQKKVQSTDVNKLHSATYDLMIKYRDTYYQNKVNKFLSRPSLKSLPEESKIKLRKELLEPMIEGDLEYSNFMEEASRRISQTFQPISGNLAELCAEKELKDNGLKPTLHYVRNVRKKGQPDIIIYHPKLPSYSSEHRVEVKNISLRERGTRGLEFAGDSLMGFFKNPPEFTSSNVEIMDQHCKKTGGYCYIPPYTLNKIKSRVKNKRFRPNTKFAEDMKKFVKTGVI